MNNNNASRIGVLYLIFQLLDAGISEIPKITLITIIVQILMYTRVLKLPWKNYEVCVNVNYVLNKRDYRRLFLAPFEHANDMHLYYNMISYLIKGKYLEKKYGSVNFLFLLLFMAVSSTSIDVMLCYFLSNWLDSPYLTSACGIGFSGVLYAFKVIIYKETTHLAWAIDNLPVSSKYIVWIELFVFHILTPDASLFGHLAGILAGLLYTSTIIGCLFDTMVSKVSVCRRDEMSPSLMKQQEVERENSAGNRQQNYVPPSMPVRPSLLTRLWRHLI